MVIFNIDTKNIDDVLEISEKEVLLKIESRIKGSHTHPDDTPVMLSLVKSSEIEGILTEPEKSFAENEMKKYKSFAAEQTSGMYLSNEKSIRPLPVCACGIEFSASATPQNIQIYEIPDYKQQISNSYNQTINY